MTRNRFVRLLSHLVSGPWTIRRSFPDTALDSIEMAIASGEQSHAAEVRVAIEHSFSPWAIVVDVVSPRERALDVFGDLRVWDTEDNNGILIYVLLADQAVEIVADRGANRTIPQAVWDKACELMHDAFQYGSFDEGVIEAVRFLNSELAGAYPPGDQNPNELPNRPTIL
ncbi:MAG: TPM domain-containing protein [Burkholderiaceae bacterium]